MVGEEDIVELTGSVWTTVLGLAIEPCHDDDVASDPEPSLIGRVNITGEWSGDVTLACPTRLARLGAAAMFDDEPEALQMDDVRDALGEVVNMIGGNIKSTLPAPSTLSIPDVKEGELEPHLSAEGRVVHSLLFSCSGEYFRLEIREHL